MNIKMIKRRYLSTSHNLVASNHLLLHCYALERYYNALFPDIADINCDDTFYPNCVTF